MWLINYAWINRPQYCEKFVLINRNSQWPKFFFRCDKLVNLVALVEGNQKVLFSIATTPRCRGGCYSFP